MENLKTGVSELCHSDRRAGRPRLQGDVSQPQASSPLQDPAAGAHAAAGSLASSLRAFSGHRLPVKSTHRSGREDQGLNCRKSQPTRAGSW